MERGRASSREGETISIAIEHLPRVTGAVENLPVVIAEVTYGNWNNRFIGCRIRQDLERLPGCDFSSLTPRHPCSTGLTVVILRSWDLCICDAAA